MFSVIRRKENLMCYLNISSRYRRYVGQVRQLCTRCTFYLYLDLPNETIRQRTRFFNVDVHDIVKLYFLFYRCTEPGYFFIDSYLLTQITRNLETGTFTIVPYHKETTHNLWQALNFLLILKRDRQNICKYSGFESACIGISE